MSKKKRTSEFYGAYVQVLIETLDMPAWRAMSHGARSLYIVLKRRWNQKHHNNGRIYLSLRQAEIEMGSKRDQVARWFRELAHFGFIVMEQPGHLGVRGRGKAPHWRLTELGTRQGTPHVQWATREYVRWDGTKFTDRPKKQKPGPENGARVVPKTGPLVVPKTGPLTEPSGPETGAIQPGPGGPENGSITNIAITPPVSARSPTYLGVGRPGRYVVSASALTQHVGNGKSKRLAPFMLSTIEVSS